MPLSECFCSSCVFGGGIEVEGRKEGDTAASSSSSSSCSNPDRSTSTRRAEPGCVVCPVFRDTADFSLIVGEEKDDDADAVRSMRLGRGTFLMILL